MVNSCLHSHGERQKGEHVVKRRFFGFFQKPDMVGAVNRTRACIHAEIMEIDGDDFVRDRGSTTNGNNGKGGKKGLRMKMGTVIFFCLSTIDLFYFRTILDLMKSKICLKK